MPLIIISVGLYILKWMELGFMENVSWWWINGFAFLTFIWFEFLERMLGFNKNKDDLHHEKMKKARLKRNFENKNK